MEGSRRKHDITVHLDNGRKKRKGMNVVVTWKSKLSGVGWKAPPGNMTPPYIWITDDKDRRE
jgi:hypothetical protein